MSDNLSVGAAVPTIYVPSSVCHLPVRVNSNPFMAATLPIPPSQTIPSSIASKLFQKQANTGLSIAKETSVEAENIKGNPKSAGNQNSAEERIKRPMNAFMIWSQMRRAEISSTTEKVHNSDISKILGKEWRAMADEDKQPYVEKARELRDQHFRDHPDYVYRPKRRKRTAMKISMLKDEIQPVLKQSKFSQVLSSDSTLLNATSTNLLQSILLNPLLCSQFIAQMAQFSQDNEYCSTQLA
ncbi:hypothetical protein WR25_09760 [Diploscapter pachys]|uniref:Sex-determining region Y protein n=1 Tax=Diploscapter pachys TaxID=2018661 RepID=A0A2A2K3B8_9BILA|nr:hypothetical protein WR25_09760 [Diploscapter pachys]